MRLIINPQSFETSSQPLPEGWHFIQQPKPRSGLVLSILTGLVLPLIPFLLLSIKAWLFPLADTRQTETVPWWILFPAIIFTVMLHEFLHLLAHPGWGLSSESMVLIWPRKLSLGVYYEGFMSRTRWLVMRLSPLLGLTLVPTLVLLILTSYEISFFWQQFTVLVILVNSLGSGGDLVASVIVAKQVPRRGEIGNWNGRACWRSNSDSY